jgi:hypothetical protein
MNEIEHVGYVINTEKKGKSLNFPLPTTADALKHLFLFHWRGRTFSSIHTQLRRSISTSFRMIDGYSKRNKHFASYKQRFAIPQRYTPQNPIGIGEQMQAITGYEHICIKWMLKVQNTQ